MDKLRLLSENRLEQIKRLTQIGVALSAEKRLDKLLELIIDEARRMTRADGGTLYILSDEMMELRFAIIQNDTLSVRMGGSGAPISWPPVKLRLPDNSVNLSHVSAYAALTGEVINIPDVYDAEGFNFDGTRQYDAQTGYRSKSMLVLPMRNHENDIIGVVQLLNSLDEATGEVCPFSLECQMMAESLSSQAAVALSKNRLIQDLEALLQSFITTIATAIDEKSPYTGGHVRRVADLTMAIVERINAKGDGPFANLHFSEDQLQELRLAAWLHDVGKITTPEYVVDKATKLETIYDRIENLKIRGELLKRDRIIELLREKLKKTDLAEICDQDSDNDPYIMVLHDDINFLQKINRGSESLSDEQLARLKEIGKRKLNIDGKLQFFLTDEELENLSIRRGTLNEKERDIINNHVRVTHKMLSKLPFPKKLRHVADYAGAHHERLDGTGYPAGLKNGDLSIQSRILALADVFEALTAKDRPYKKGKTVKEAVSIMKDMVRDRHLDADLFDLFLQEKIYLGYDGKETVPLSDTSPSF
ncbi:MAG: HD domain-containing protein [Syntrophales bacterium]|nr:HD domain-containing protein [Syntrophales bacterium]